ncbi:ribonuclease H-like domain-containing protein [Tanacetum coccineum]
MINDVAHIEAKVAGKKILVSEASVRTDLMFNDEDGTNCFKGYWNLKDSKPFLMYPRFIQLFLNKQLEGSTKPQTFLPTVVLPPKVFTFMRKCSPKFSGKLTPLTPPMLKVVTAVRAEHALHTEDLDISSSLTSHSFVNLKPTLSKKKTLKKAHKKKSSSFKQGRKKVSDGNTGLNEVDVNSGDSQMMDVDDTITTEVHEGTAQVNEGTTEVNEVEDEASPSTFQDESNEFIQDDTLIADTLINITRPRRGAGITIPGNISEQERSESPTQILDPNGDDAQDVEVMEQRSSISSFSIIQSPEGEYIAIQRANGHIRAFNTLNEVLHILDRQDLHNLHRLVIKYYEHIPPIGLGLILHGDLTTMMETTEESDVELDVFNDPNWQNAMSDEYNALIKNNTWNLVPRPTNANIVRCMWLFRYKYLAGDTLSRYKTRLVANGSTQIEGVDVDETLSPVVKPRTIQTVLSLAIP